jgi:16S rRNA (adenine1518-N6/adenine1519-N6)-dimethyltransferase
MFKKSLSQHILREKNILKKMLHRTNITKKDVVVEIGAGTGELTLLLKDMADLVYAIEIDRSFSTYLDEIARKNENVKVIYDDFLKIDLKRFMSNDPLKVIGNIPYGITGPILFKIFGERKYIDSAFLLLQREVAERMTAKPKSRSYGSLSVITQIIADVRIELLVPKELFIPKPKVESAFVSLFFKEESKSVSLPFFKFVRRCFRHKRKFLLNSLKSSYPMPLIESLFAKANLERRVRAEEIPPDKFLEMFYIIGGEGG